MNQLLRLISLGYVFVTMAAFGASPLQISEFMASNSRTLADEDGAFSDWLEIQNTSGAPVSLAGYYLSDDPANLQKWACPVITIAPGSNVVIFASGKNRSNPANPLHTNFQLDGQGEFLALTDGTNIVHGYVPQYPPQKEDIAYGIAEQRVTQSLLAQAVPWLLIPAQAGDLDAQWNQPGFTPGANWFTGAPPAAIGFDTNKAAGTPGNVALSGTAVQSTTLSSYPANLGNNNNTGDFTHTTSADTSPFWQVTLTNTFAISRVVLYNRSSCCGSRLRDITVQIIATNASGLYTNWQSALLNPENTGYAYPSGPATITVDLVALAGEPVLGHIVRVKRTPDPDFSGSGGQGNADEAAVLSLGEVVVEGVLGSDFGQYIRTDVQSQMLGKNASLFLQIPFVVENTTTPDLLTLLMRYDDGFVAYLNGTEVARRNVSGTPAWNSTAVTNRTLAGARLQESINLTAQAGLLTPGTNWLAIQAMNISAADADFLIVPELLSAFVLISSNAWLEDATPGLVNDTSFYYGEVADTTFSVDRGFFNAPFELRISTPTDGATIYYSFNADEPGPGKGMVYTGPITITNTTVVRARAFKQNLKPTDVDTQTYLFLDDVIYQAPTGAAPQYFPASWGRNRVDYGMDPNIVSRYTLEQWREALTQIPTISIVTEMPNLFDPATGIYANADGHGEDWERPSSMELLEPTNAVPGRFQAPCGLRIRGGWSRSSTIAKHSFRIFFRRDYGLGRLRYPMFGDQGAQEFDTFDLRTSQNYSWPREGVPNGNFETMVREVWCRQTLGAMGQPYRRSQYYHLYLNGQYWGLFETDERPEASYGEIYLGGNKDDYDVVKCGNHVANFVTEVTDGNFASWSNLWTRVRSVPGNPSNSNYFRILGCNADGTRNPALPVMLNVDNLIDYMLGIFFSGDGDATLSAFLSDTRPNNWFAMKNRANPEMGWIFFNSDCEHTLGAPSWRTDRTGPFSGLSGSNVGNFTYSNPQYMHEDLMNNPEYRLRFADRVQKHFFNGGALTFAATTNRWWAKANQINKAIRAYSARWGDSVKEPPYGETEWTAAVAAVPGTILPSRSDTVLGQLKIDNLYPSVNAPSFSRHGGNITNGFALGISLNNASGVVYYTLDGSDPRLVGGTVAPMAVAYSGPVILNTGTRVKARALVGGAWSALVEADFISPDVPPLRITEIMYHPAATTPAEITAGFTNAEAFEFIELRNIGAQAVPLAGVSFIEGISFTFADGTLAPGARLLLVKDAAAFAFRYGTNLSPAGVFGGQLANNGETLHLVDAGGRTIQRFSYSDGWLPVTDGLGFSLVVADDTAPVTLWDTKSNWRQSGTANGNPGADNVAPPVFPAVVVNEILVRPGVGQTAGVELANLGDTPADISGWWLSDDIAQPKKYQFPPNTVIPANSFLVVTAELLGPAALGTNAILWSASGGDVRLFSADAAGKLTGYYHGFDFGASDAGMSFGRHLVSTGGDNFVAQVRPTLSEANAGPLVGPVVISEIMYHPPDVDGTNITREEYLELVNISTNDVPLFDPAEPALTWRISGGVDYLFPTNIWLAPGERLVLVNFNPATNPDERTAFRQKYGLPENVRVLGALQGNLANTGEDVELKRPIRFDTGFAGEVLAERISYRDQSPWPAGADGYGASLQRRDLAAYGNDPANWVAALPTAGNVAPTGEPPAFSVQPAGQTVVEGSSVTFSATASGEGAITYLWRYQGGLIATNTTGILTLTDVTPASQGTYKVAAVNSYGVTVSSNAALTVLTLPALLAQPRSLDIKVGSNATFTVSAASPWPLNYQWQYNGVDLPGNNSPTLVLTNVQIANEGNYRVIVSDVVGARVSESAWLQPLILMTKVVDLPTTRSVTAGVDVAFSAVFSGYPPPYTYTFQRTLTTIDTLVSDQTNVTFTLYNVQFTNAGLYRISAAGRTNSVASVFCNLTVASWPLITNQPVDRIVNPGGNATLTAGVAGTPTLVYRWYYQGTNLVPGATTANLTITNVQAGVNDGAYLLVITNNLGATTSEVAQVMLRRPASIAQQPEDFSGTVNSNATFTVVAEGGGPYGYQWYYGAATSLAFGRSDTLVLTNLQPADAGAYWVVVTNDLGSATSRLAQLTVATGDADGDGLPDAWEAEHNLGAGPGNGRDDDPDGDGRTNWEEYLSGTHPRDAGSVLKVELADLDQVGAALTFTARPNIGYSILYLTNLTDGVWQTLTNLAPQTGTNTVTIHDPAARTQCAIYYRISTRP